MPTVSQTTGHGSLPGTAPFCTSQEELNRKVVHRLYGQVANQHDFTNIDEVVAADVQVHSTIPHLEPGRSGLRRLVDTYMQLFPERHLELHDLIAAGDRVVVRYTLYGTYRDGLTAPVVAGRTREAALNGMAIARFADQRIVELWHQDDLPHLPGASFAT